jgi:hypothetical protein
MGVGMKRIVLLLLALFCVACEADPPKDENQITAACRRSFADVLQAWEAELGRVSEACDSLDAMYAIQVVSEDEMPCEEGIGDNQARGGCFLGGVLYLLEHRSNSALVDSAVHEWVHALAQCIDGDVDRFHLRVELWGDYGTDTIEVEARANAQIGECL